VPVKVNWHWRPHYDLCHPCHIRYDFLGHYETLHRDADAVLAAIGATDRVKFPKTDRDNRRKRNTSELVADMYKGLPTEHVQLLKTRVYRNDFMLFDFDWNRRLHHHDRRRHHVIRVFAVNVAIGLRNLQIVRHSLESLL